MSAPDAFPHRIDDLLRHREWVGALARSLVRDESTAEDLVQDTFTAALDHPPADRRSPRGWLATVLHNRLIDRRRVEARRARRELASARAEAVPSAARPAAVAEAQRKVLAAVVALGKAWVEEGDAEACVRAITLGALVVEGDPEMRYDAAWWEGEVLVLRGILGYAQAAERPGDAKVALDIIRALADLGLLDRSPLRAEFLRLESEAQALADR
jgi:hypothetical protein